MIFSEDNENRCIIFSQSEDCLCWLKIYMLEKSHVAEFCKGKENPRLYKGFKVYITKCTSQKHFKLVFFFVLIYSSVRVFSDVVIYLLWECRCIVDLRVVYIKLCAVIFLHSCILCLSFDNDHFFSVLKFSSYVLVL